MVSFSWPLLRCLPHRLVALSQAAETKGAAGERKYSLFFHGWLDAYG